ncbi:Uncharacterised protein [Mammaliicoccus stepanovicii]|uniref:Uncharacterized protein n=1 Tax=Mammaliicoccus stepanovicii TaxID=643214 RepID=A0A239YEX9_9STAP|nr:hypothetical protein CD111_12200 [Mammaliicoccus stepanovicii]SNV57801.1 Uncharacterised protein [Mammaliicoccus stepanovicii]
MKNKHYCLTFFFILIFCVSFQGITNLLSDQPFLTNHDIIHNIIPFMLFIIFMLYISYKHNNKNV